tara:strand:- start:2392 stop:2643 length:252 start_codon:yes stop_codon:yes gene_type:complete
MTHFKQFYYNSFVKLILEVFGASGAVWGTSEVLTLRNSDTQNVWRCISSIVGFAFLVRFGITQRRTYLKLKSNSPSNSTNNLQ